MSMEVKVFNNLTRKKEIFRPVKPGEVHFYSCGPTTYDFVHVGNARAFVVGDLIHRVFKSLDYKVTFVRNFTDVDDKIIERAHQLNVNPLDHADRFVKECTQDMNSLGMLPATHTPKVSETMKEIIAMIEDLIKNGFAYVVDGEVLYHVPLFKEYGKLSKKDLESLQHGIRVDVDQHKKHPSDFVLWKPAKPGEVTWDSPWGKGRPGWHIECSAMAKKFLGKTIDIHHGGVDLMFPHHENEIAQSEAANGCEFCHHWVHNEFLNFGNEKMSKSLGNVITIRKFVETFSGELLRHILLSVHYRSPLDWNDEALDKALGEMERIHQFVMHVQNAQPQGTSNRSTDILKVIDLMREEFANDFNVPGALAHFYTLIRTYNRDFQNQVSVSEKEAFLKVIDFVATATGLVHKNAQETLALINRNRATLKPSDSKMSSEEIEKLIIERKEARASKNWKRADEIRDIFNAANIVLKDNPDGTVTWSYK